MSRHIENLNRRELLQAGAVAGAAWGLRSLRAEMLISEGGVQHHADQEETLSFDASRIPLSRFGSYLAVSHRFWNFGISPEVQQGQFYIRCLQDDPSPPEIFRIEMLKDGVPVTPTPEATVGCYSLRSGEAAVEFCIAEYDLIRVRGKRCTLRLHTVTRPYANAVQESADSWLIMPDPVRSDVQVKRVSGAMHVDAPWVDRLHNVQCDKATLTFDPGPDGSFECSLLFFEGIPRKGANRGSFDQDANEVASHFEQWAARVPALATRYEPGRKLAAYVLWSNTVSARGLYTTPVVWGSKNWMARIWSWDHCFCALGLAESHPELAWEQFMLFHQMQDPVSGMLADSMSNVQRSWWATKDPVHGWTLSHLLKLMPNYISRDRLQEVYDPLCRWTEFWIKHRNFDGDGLPCIIHPDESFDNTTNNSVGGPAKAPEIATYLALQMDALAEVAQRLGKNEEARQWRDRSNSLVQTMLRVLWDEQRQRFVSKRVGDGFVSPGDCLLTYMPLMLGERLPPHIRGALIQGLTRTGGFVTPYGFSTEALDSPLFDGESYVKGPTWAPLNTFLIEALNKAGEVRIARQIQNGFCDTILRHGMSEHFDAHTGNPQGDPSYIWTAALFLLMGSRKFQAGNMFA